MRSVKNKLHLIEALAEEHGISALCLTETWITSTKIDLLSIEGYNTASLFCRSSYEGGGVTILLKEGIEYIECEDINAISVEYLIEICAIDIINLNTILIVKMGPIKPNPAKTLLRNEIANRIAALTAEEKQTQSKVVFNKVINHPWYKNAKRISLYMSTEDEINTAPIIAHLQARGAAAFVPQYAGGVP
ncbi:putative 5-formyltetrahydrofolate cyclo-ligase-like protein [Operophtera brumata]|uniref:5-formyltetrahydrofolate cyclo-ligase n=1 Tax=Operophtera brumata TaxID=104452 RepID=A0A0L7KNR2_OPEBR|nr:putative 5-formyltetrahydrofolate cyclo-ligase-like protein [Operophtera brumata]